MTTSNDEPDSNPASQPTQLANQLCKCGHPRIGHVAWKDAQPKQCVHTDDCECAIYRQADEPADDPALPLYAKTGPDATFRKATPEEIQAAQQGHPPDLPLDTHCPTCGDPVCHNCRHHRVAHRALSHPPGKYTACQRDTCACLQYEPPPAEPTYSILYHSDEYRGDHSAEVVIGIAEEKEETIGELFERIAQTTGRTIKPTDYITIRTEVTDE